MALRQKLLLLAAVTTAVFSFAGEKTTAPSPEHEVLRGRVLADVASLAFGTGLAPKWTSFIFAAETSSGKAVPVRIAYVFYESEQLPPESFWDYSRLYDLSVKRDRTCDTTVREISFEKNVDAEGNELPASLVLRPTKGAPPGTLKPEAVLPCYILWYDHYKPVVTPVPR
jgi:hypothetical protein